MEAVDKAPGLSLLLKGYAPKVAAISETGGLRSPGDPGEGGPPPSKPSQQRPSAPARSGQPSRRLFEWDREEGESEEDEDERSQEDSRGGDSFTTLQSANLIAQLNRVVKQLLARVGELESAASARDASLGDTISRLRRQVRSLER